MTDDSKAKVGKQAPKEFAHAVPEATEVYCRRLHRNLPVVEHKACPYCFGEQADIKTGDHEKFCDFEEGKDPISFGFPET